MISLPSHWFKKKKKSKFKLFCIFIQKRRHERSRLNLIFLNKRWLSKFSRKYWPVCVCVFDWRFSDYVLPAFTQHLAEWQFFPGCKKKQKKKRVKTQTWCRTETTFKKRFRLIFLILCLFVWSGEWKEVGSTASHERWPQIHSGAVAERRPRGTRETGRYIYTAPFHF